MSPKEWSSHQRRSHLGIDDMPCVRHEELVLSSKGPVASAGGAKGHHADVAEPQLLCNVKGCQCGQRSPQGMPCKTGCFRAKTPSSLASRPGLFSGHDITLMLLMAGKQLPTLSSGQDTTLMLLSLSSFAMSKAPQTPRRMPFSSGCVRVQTSSLPESTC